MALSLSDQFSFDPLVPPLLPLCPSYNKLQLISPVNHTWLSSRWISARRSDTLDLLRAANAFDFIVNLPILRPSYDCTIVVVNLTISTLADYLTYYAAFWVTNIGLVGHGGALVESIAFNRRVVGSTPALAAM